MLTKDTIVNAPLFPLYSHVKSCIQCWNGELIQSVKDMMSSIGEQTGTPQNPVDWTMPDKWIPERLDGEHARLAMKLWVSSQKTVNPRHIWGCYLLINRLSLMEQVGGRYQVNDRARKFLDDDPNLLREIDRSEGIPKLLSLVSEKSPVKRADIIEDWSSYLLAVSKFSKPSTFNDTLRRRLLNLVERELIEREGTRYSVTDKGAAYLSSIESSIDYSPEHSERREITLAVSKFNISQYGVLRTYLMKLSPYDFEHFVKALLDAMDYENVEVTKQSGDKGVDVVANFQFGITEIREVVQVKRTENTIGRRVIDELRGALHYHRAIRGTIITLGNFVRGLEEFALYPGAAPITLIDGKRLIDLAVKHGIGTKKKTIELIEINEAFFKQFENDEEVEIPDGNNEITSQSLSG